jgi:general secretion pathway protein G
MPASKYAKRGFSLIEMLVAVSILSILASVALPYAKHGMVRAKEVQLRRALRTVRSALDDFHRDCQDSVISKKQEGVSRNCYPQALQTLVEGVETGNAGGDIKRYLRRVPRDPFLTADVDTEDNWQLRAYEDDIDSSIWGGDDVYDIRVTYERQALDGSEYQQW